MRVSKAQIIEFIEDDLLNARVTDRKSHARYSFEALR